MCWRNNGEQQACSTLRAMITPKERTASEKWEPVLLVRVTQVALCYTGGPVLHRRPYVTQET